MRSIFLFSTLGIALCACQAEKVNISYSLSSPILLELYSEGYFATIDLEGVERMGTITATYSNVEFSNRGDTLYSVRRYEIDKSRGYLKNYMPSELSFRAAKVSLSALDREVLSIEGLESGYDSLVHALPMPEVWRKQLLNPDYPKHLLRAEKHRWEMTHLLLGEIPSKENITELLKSKNRLNFALIRIDSVVTEGFRKLDGRNCLSYTVYLEEAESFPYYIWEQHVNSDIVPKEFKKYNKGLKAVYRTAYQVALEPEGGILCQEREVKRGVHTMVNPETADTATFTSNITYERLYTQEPLEKN